MDKVLDQLVDVVTGNADFEGYVRSLLKLLERVSGLESTYLTTVDLTLGSQSILYARNTAEMNIPEGLEVPWEDTLCRRSLEEGVTFTSDVETVWSDSSAARGLGIKPTSVSRFMSATVSCSARCVVPAKRRWKSARTRAACCHCSLAWSLTMLSENACWSRSDWKMPSTPSTP